MRKKEEFISMLVHLSAVDNYVAGEETKLIRFIAEQQGLKPEKVDALIKNPLPIPSFKALPRTDRFQYLFDIIQLIKIDGKIFSSEINLAEKLAVKLGFRVDVVAELSAYIYSDPDITTNKEFLFSLAAEYIID